MLLALPAKENDICSQQTRFLGSKYTENAADLQPQTLFLCI